MFAAANTFVYSVLVVYTLYQYYQSQDEQISKRNLKFALMQMKWWFFFLSLILMVIHSAHRASSEVNMSHYSFLTT